MLKDQSVNLGKWNLFWWYFFPVLTLPKGNGMIRKYSHFEFLYYYYYQILISFGQIHPLLCCCAGRFWDILFTSVLPLLSPHFHFSASTPCYPSGPVSYTNICYPVSFNCLHSAVSPNANLFYYLFKYPRRGHNLWKYSNSIHIYAQECNITLK